jgi:hypothetical protein
LGGGGAGGLGVGAAGTANTGGGGGGGGNSPNTVGAAGGSGIVIIRISSIYSATFSAGLTTTANTTIQPGFRIYSVTAGTGTVTFT